MRFYLIILFSLGFTLSVNAQPGTTAVPFITVNNSVQSLSLGSGNVAGKGDTWVFHLNPAGIFYGDATARLSFHTFVPYSDFYDMRINSIIGGHQFRKLAISYSLVNYDLGTNYITAPDSPEVIDEFRSYEVYVNFSAAYHFENGFSVGGGLNYIHSNLGGGQSINSQGIFAGEAISVDVGTRYENTVYTSDYFSITFSAGLSLTDFGNKIKYIKSVEGDPLPMIMRGGLGISLKSEKQLKGLDLYEVKYYGALSKYMSGYEIKSDSTVEGYGPVKALYKTWGSYEWFNGMEYIQVSPGDQIWKHSGIEFSVLETFYFRIGEEMPEMLVESSSYNAIGFGIDLYYLRFDYARVNYKRGYPFERKQYFWQFSGRIPLDGKRPDSILNFFF
ncbi:MAG: PorV/PorQ family protein [Balneolaceae bacterium]